MFICLLRSDQGKSSPYISGFTSFTSYCGLQYNGSQTFTAIKITLGTEQHQTRPSPSSKDGVYCGPATPTSNLPFPPSLPPICNILHRFDSPSPEIDLTPLRSPPRSVPSRSILTAGERSGTTTYSLPLLAR